MQAVMVHVWDLVWTTWYRYRDTAGLGPVYPVYINAHQCTSHEEGRVQVQHLPKYDINAVLQPVNEHNLPNET